MFTIEKFGSFVFFLMLNLTFLSYNDFVPDVHFKTEDNLHLKEHALTALLRRQSKFSESTSLAETR